MNKEEAGLTLLGLTTSSALWSWGNSSLFTIRSFVHTDEDKANARYGMNVSIAMIVVFALGLYLLYGSHGFYPALFTVVSGLVYYYIYNKELNKND